MFFKTKKFFFLLLAIVSIGTATFYAPDAYADYTVNQGEKCQDGSDPQRVTNNGSTTYTCADTTRTQNGGQQQTGNGAGQGGTPAEGTTCAVEKIGWIVCPVIEGAAKMTDYLFKFLATYFLEIEAELLTSNPENGKGTITAWEQARNLANIMFVIAFIIIIYSQITGSGLNNYGVKRMLPRLIIAAIAVNVSYYICQAMVDFSNILGYNIMKALQDISNEIGPSVMSQADQGLNTQTGDGTLAKLTIFALAAAGIVWVILAIMSGSIFAILVICLVCLVILLLRKAFIVLLVVISPIAFVMYLLPNTEKYFSKWLNMFWNLLLVFPIVALLLGGGQLASTIILVAGSQEASKAPACDSNQAPATATGAVRTDTYGIEGECSVPLTSSSGKTAQATLTTGFVAAGIAVAPLLAVWSVLQGALAAAGAIGGKISGAVSKGGDRVGGVAGKGAELAKKRVSAETQAAWQRSQARGLAKEGGRLDKLSGAYARRSARRAARIGASQEELSRGMAEAASGITVGGLTEAGQRRAQARAFGAQDKINSEELKNELTQIEYHDDGKLEGAKQTFAEAINTNDATKAKASVAALMTTGEKGIEELTKQLNKVQAEANRTGNHALANTLKEYMMQAHGNVKDKNAAIHAWTTSGYNGTTDVDHHASDAATYAKLSDAQFATQTEASLNSTGARQALRLETRNAQGLLQTRGNRLLSNPESAANFSDSKRNIITSNGGTTPPHL